VVGMSDDSTPDPVPVNPADQPERIRPSATGLEVPGGDEPADSAVGDADAADDAANDLPG
jgi:hypothetical protein